MNSNPTGITVEAEAPEGGKPGARIRFPYDRALVERFREKFPAARWLDEKKLWRVPGIRAEQRLTRWLHEQVLPSFEFADARGRDAFAFDPINSSYLSGADEILVSTPFSRTVVATLQAIPWAWWDGENKVWHVPYRSYDQLRAAWEKIEAAARRNEPEERRRRRVLDRGTEAGERSRARATERRKRRYPVPLHALPPLDRPLVTEAFGLVVFERISGELIDAPPGEIYGSVFLDAADYTWASWRPAAATDLTRLWPSHQPPSPQERQRGWWLPTRRDYGKVWRQERAKQRRGSSGA